MKTKILLSIIIACLLVSCNKEEHPEEKKIYDVNGVAQKGPFIQGSHIYVSELDDELNQTGINFRTEIKNNLGDFELSGISLLTPNVELSADGYYFNEVDGVLSQSRLVLRSLSNLSDSSETNINLLTHITADRIRTLFDGGEDFEEARNKAEEEVLLFFNMDSIDTGSFSNLDMGDEQEKNALLIAISSIFQGRNSVAELSLLLADFIEDFEPDGTIDDAGVRAELEHNAKHLDTLSLRMHLENHYNSLGIDLSAPDFEQFLRRYFDSIAIDTSFEMTFPDTGMYGENILAMVTGQEIIAGTEYSICAKFPAELNLLVRLKINANGHSQASWMTDELKQENWFGTLLDGHEIVGQITGGIADMSVVFSGSGEIEIQLAIFKDDIVDEYIGDKTIFLTVK